jgi:hypothetical protein
MDHVQAFPIAARLSPLAERIAFEIRSMNPEFAGALSVTAPVTTVAISDSSGFASERVTSLSCYPGSHLLTGEHHSRRLGFKRDGEKLRLGFEASR